MKKTLLLLTLLLSTFILTGCTKTFVITFETNGGTVVTNVEYQEGEELNFPDNPTKEGHIFDGWYYDEYLTEQFSLKDEITRDMTLYAKWLVVTFNVNFESEHGVTMLWQEVPYGDTAMVPVEPTKEGYTFDDWYLEDTFVNAYDFSSNVYEEITLYGKWIINEYQITFKYNNGDPDATTNLEHGSTPFDLPLELLLAEKEGFIQEDWYLDEAMTLPLTIDTVFTEDMTLYLKWEEQVVDFVIDVWFVPSRPADEILEVTAPLEYMLLEALTNLGYDITDVNLHVGNTYEQVRDNLLSGVADIAFIPAFTYGEILNTNSDAVGLIASSGRQIPYFNPDAPDEWNDGVPSVNSEESKPFYQGLIIAGTSQAGQVVGDIVRTGGTLTWDDVKDLNWCVRSVTSSSGYVYPNQWLVDNFGKTFDDITGQVTTTSGYGSSMAGLADGTCDVGTFYGDARMHYADIWTSSYGRSESIWVETTLIGITRPIMNDVIAVNTNNIESTLLIDIIDFFFDMKETQEGQEILNIYSIRDLITTTDEDYDTVREIYDNE